MIHSKYSLAIILKFWEELYSKIRSITDQQEIINSFRKKKKEPLIAAMLRVTVNIDQMPKIQPVGIKSMTNSDATS